MYLDDYYKDLSNELDKDRQNLKHLKASFDTAKRLGFSSTANQIEDEIDYLQDCIMDKRDKLNEIGSKIAARDNKELEEDYRRSAL